MGETKTNATERTIGNTDEAIETVKFGGKAHYIIPQIVGSESQLGKRITSHGIMKPVGFTSMELKALAYDIDKANVTNNSVLNAKVRIEDAIRALDEEHD